jgi:hypothetical protein
MHPVVALETAGVEMDVLGLTYPEYSSEEQEAVVQPPRTPHFCSLKLKCPRNSRFGPLRFGGDQLWPPVSID